MMGATGQMTDSENFKNLTMFRITVITSSSGLSDEDINPMDTNDTPQDDIQGPITRARARQLNLQVSSFLSNVYCKSENRLLPNDLIVLRNKG